MSDDLAAANVNRSYQLAASSIAILAVCEPRIQEEQQERDIRFAQYTFKIVPSPRGDCSSMLGRVR